MGDLIDVDKLRDMMESVTHAAEAANRLRRERDDAVKEADRMRRMLEAHEAFDAMQQAEAARAEVTRMADEFRERWLMRESKRLPGWLLSVSGYGRPVASSDAWVSVFYHVRLRGWVWATTHLGATGQVHGPFASPEAAAAAVDAAHPPEARDA